MTVRVKMNHLADQLELAVTGLRDGSAPPALAVEEVRKLVVYAGQQLGDLLYEIKNPLLSGTESPAAITPAPKDHL